MSDGFNNLENDVLLSMVIEDDEPGSYEESLLDKIAQERLLKSVDTKTGAPANVRAAVSGAQSPDDRLATLKNFYPDALPVEVLTHKMGQLNSVLVILCIQVLKQDSLLCSMKT